MIQHTIISKHLFFLLFILLILLSKTDASSPFGCPKWVPGHHKPRRFHVGEHGRQNTLTSAVSPAAAAPCLVTNVQEAAAANI